MREEVRGRLQRTNSRKELALSPKIPSYELREVREDVKQLQEELTRLHHTKPTNKQLRAVEEFAKHILNRIAALYNQESTVDERAIKQLRIQTRILESDLELVAQGVVELQQELDESQLHERLAAVERAKDTNNPQLRTRLTALEKQHQTHRETLANTQDLRAQIDKLSQRVQALEQTNTPSSNPEQPPTPTAVVNRVNQLEERLEGLEQASPKEIERLREWVAYLLEKQGYIER